MVLKFDKLHDKLSIYAKKKFRDFSPPWSQSPIISIRQSPQLDSFCRVATHIDKIDK